MISITLFSISGLSIILFVLIKHIEHTRGRLFFAGNRHALDQAVRRLSCVLSLHMPRAGRLYVRTVASELLVLTTSIALRAVRYAEGRLSRILDLIKGKGAVRKKGSASFFLQDVLEHKSDLRRERDARF